MARLCALIALVAALAVATAHPVPSPDTFLGGSYGGTAIKVTHGCEAADGTPLGTTSIAIEVPGALGRERVTEVERGLQEGMRG